MKSLTNGGSGYINGINNRRARRRRKRHELKEDSNYLIHCYAAGAGTGPGRGRRRKSQSGIRPLDCCEEFHV